MKIREYMPSLYENNAEMNALLYSEELEFENNVKPNVDNVFNDNFVVKATTNGLENFEKILSITANPSTESITFRRERIINRLMSNIPFTERFLQSQLDTIIGKNTNADFTPDNSNNQYWYYEINYNNYTLDIYITIPGRGWLNELYNMLSEIIPCNILYTVNVYAASWGQVNEHFTSWDDLTSMTWQDVKDALWINN